MLSTAERDELRATARSLLASRSSSERVRATIDTADGWDRALWAEMAALGWTAIHVDEALGGAGCGCADLVVVLQELGRALTPSPFLASAVLATGALASADAAVGGPLLARLAGGELLGTVALAGEGGSCDPAARTVTWAARGATVRIDGTAGFVLDADVAGVLVVPASSTDGVTSVLAVELPHDGVSVERVPTVDRTRRLFRVRFDGVEVGADRQLAEPGSPADALVDRVLALGVVAAAADATGVAEKALEDTVRYATDRQQFGRPIGSFQAVKHHCADMAVAVEASRAAVRGAAAELDDPAQDGRVTAGITASFVGPACSTVCGLAMRVHGGIGFTWEHDTHLQMKRVKLDEVLFGTPSWHRRRLADAVFPTRAAR